MPVRTDVITTVIVIDHDLLSGTEAEIEALIPAILTTRRRAVAARTAAKVPESLTERSRSGSSFLFISQGIEQCKFNYDWHFSGTDLGKVC